MLKIGSNVRTIEGYLGVISRKFPDGRFGVEYDKGIRFSAWEMHELTEIQPSEVPSPPAFEADTIRELEHKWEGYNWAEGNRICYEDKVWRIAYFKNDGWLGIVHKDMPEVQYLEVGEVLRKGIPVLPNVV